MKYKSILLLLFIPLFSFCQTQDDILKLSQTQTVRIVAISFNQKHQEFIDYGKGIVLKGKYLATCYHLIQPEDTSYKLFSIYLIYNEHTKNGKFTYDSISLQRNFKTTKDQYDFSKHVYLPYDYSTDFIVLKLLKPLQPIKYEFATKQPQPYDSTYSLGNIDNGDYVNPFFQLGLFVFNYTYHSIKQPVYFACIVQKTFGFSGSPLYNSHGEILGIIQSSIETFPNDLLLFMLNNKRITIDVVNSIRNGFQNGYKIQLAIDFNFLKAKYLKGYL